MPYGVYLPGRWRQQPQGAVRIDWSHPLANGLVYANLLGPQNVDLVQGALPTTTGTRQRARQFGVARGFGATLGVGTTDLVTGTLPSSFDRYTTSIRSLRNGAGGNSLGRLHSNLNSECYYNVLSNRTDVTRSAVTTSGIWFFGEAWATGIWRTTTVSFDGPTPSAPKVYIDGNAQTVSVVTAPSGNFLSISGSMAVGNYVSGSLARVWDGLHQDFFVWSRILSDGETRAQHENPYQVLAPIRPILYSFPSAATAPTLSAATVIDIGTTSARPRVTVTFS